MTPHPIDHTLFPPLPAYQVTGAPVLLEPTLGSEERLCLAVVAVGNDGAWQTAPILNEEKATALVGEQAGSLLGFMRLGMAHLNRHLAGGQPLATWRAPIAGMMLGPLTHGRADSLNMMLRMIARSHAFLAALADFDSAAEPPVSPAPERDRWLDQVRQEVSARQPPLSAGFGRRLRLVPNGAETRFDYLGQRIVAQLGRVIPGPNIADHVRRAKAKLWDLEALRDVGMSDLLSVAAHELLLYRPSADDPAYSEREIVRLQEALVELESAGDRQALRVSQISTTREAADHIIQAEAA